MTIYETDPDGLEDWCGSRNVSGCLLNDLTVVVDESLDVIGKARVLIHETLHHYLWCAYGDPDRGHERRDIWRDLQRECVCDILFMECS